MKLLALFGAIFLFIPMMNFAQEMDMQWYITNSKGLNGEFLSQNPIPNSTEYEERDLLWSLELGSSFIVGGVSLPQSVNPPGADQIFVIFEDASFFSSRYSTNPSISNNIRTGVNGGKFIPISTEAPISEAYYSNIYDTDDLPEEIRVEDGGGGNLVIAPFTEAKMDAENFDTLMAHNTVLPGKDITFTILNYKFEEPDSLIFTYNKVIPSSGVDVISKKVKDPSKINAVTNLFSESYIFSRKTMGVS